MITRLQVRGFKSLLDVDLTLAPLTVLVGANGSGKTSVLEAIGFLQDVAFWTSGKGASSDEPRTSRRGSRLSRFLSRQGNGSLAISAWMTAEGSDGQFELQIQDEAYELTVREASRTSKKTKASDELSDWANEVAAGIELYRLDADEMAQAVYSDEPAPELDFDGHNLAAVLDALRGEDRDRFDEIERRLVEFIPSLRRLRVKRARALAPKTFDAGRHDASSPLELTGHQVAFDFAHAPDVDARDASEGTLRLLGLLTVIESQPPGDMTLMLDDLDRALHPKAQRELVGYLHQLIRSRPGLQIIATSHSPYLVEHLEYTEVRAVTQAPDGTSVVASLGDHPLAERWREEMSLDET
jgi:predicted ATPase